VLLADLAGNSDLGSKTIEDVGSATVPIEDIGFPFMQEAVCSAA
jgi:hypothetical protein